MFERDILVLLAFWLIAAIIGVLRFLLGPSDAKINLHDVYKDIAHLFTGGLYGAWLVFWCLNDDWSYFWPAICLTILEVVAFLYFKFRK